MKKHLKITFGNFFEGLIASFKLRKINNAITFFGSARTPDNHREYESVRNLAETFAELGFQIITGGGEKGLMKAANQGCVGAFGTSVGLNIKLPCEQAPNAYQNISTFFNYFSARNISFYEHSKAFIVGAGGFGTLYEAFQVLTLMQCGKIARRPFVFTHLNYYKGLLEWVEKDVVEQGKISHIDTNLYLKSDNEREIVYYVLNGIKK